MKRRAFHLIKIVALAVLLQSAAVDAAGPDMRQIVENTDRMLASAPVREKYILPLQLEGKSFRGALETLLGEGFRWSSAQRCRR